MFDYVQARQRRQGQIKRRVRNPDNLSLDQWNLAEQMADRYQVELTHAATYLDWYAALTRGWITQETFDQEMEPHNQSRSVNDH